MFYARFCQISCYGFPGKFCHDFGHGAGKLREAEVTEPLAVSPKVSLLIGNSYSFYNCGVHTYLRGFMKAGTPKENMKTRLLTISSGALSFHDVGFYLSPHEQDPYAVVKDGKLTKPMFDVVLLQGYSAAAVSKKRLPYFEKYAAAHAETIRNAGQYADARDDLD